MSNCAEKFLKHSERIGSRFAELNAGTYTCSGFFRPSTHMGFRAGATGAAPFMICYSFLLDYAHLTITLPSLEALTEREADSRCISLCLKFGPTR